MKPIDKKNENNVVETQPLKQLFPEVHQRQKYQEQKKAQCKLNYPVLVRIEPHPKT